MYHFLFHILNDPLGLPVNDLWEYAILAILGLIAFGWEIAPSGRFGSLMHWAIRFVVFLLLWASAYAVLAAIQWVIAHLLLVCSILLIGTLVILAASATKFYLL